MDYGWRTAYLFIGILICILILPFTLFVIRLNPSEKGLYPLGGENTSAVSQEKKVLVGITQGQTFKSVSFWALCLAIVVGSIVVNGMLVNMAPYFTDIGTSAHTAALLLSLSSVMVIVGKLLIGRLYDRIGLITTILIICGGNILSFVFLIKGNILLFGILYCLFAGLGVMAITVTPSYVTGSLYGEKDFSAKFGIVSLFTSLGAAITPIITGAIYNVNHSYGMLINVLIVLSVVTFVLFVIAIKTKPKFDGHDDRSNGEVDHLKRLASRA